jgi:hypothetical protein
VTTCSKFVLVVGLLGLCGCNDHASTEEPTYALSQSDAIQMAEQALATRGYDRKNYRLDMSESLTKPHFENWAFAYQCATNQSHGCPLLITVNRTTMHVDVVVPPKIQ